MWCALPPDKPEFMPFEFWKSVHYFSRYEGTTHGHTYIHTYKHTEIQTYRQTDIQTDRHTDRQTEPNYYIDKYLFVVLYYIKEKKVFAPFIIEILRGSTAEISKSQNMVKTIIFIAPTVLPEWKMREIFFWIFLVTVAMVTAAILDFRLWNLKHFKSLYLFYFPSQYDFQ